MVNVQVVANGKQTAVRACDAARRNRKSFKKMTITKTLGEGSANIPALGFATLRVQGADVVRTRARFVLPAMSKRFPAIVHVNC